MDNVNLEVFRFQAGVDYLPYYTKLVFTFSSQHKLSHLLTFLHDEIGDYGYDKTYLALRINHIVIFEDMSITELVQRFGTEWQIEPLSIYYANKDLLLNKDALWRKYDTFFTEADFISEVEKKELGKYLILNLITSMENEDYLGDGFFLYLKWLISRHPHKMQFFTKWLLDKNGGILYFVSLADMVYPRANTLDEEIWELMRDIVFSYESKQIKALTTLKCGRKG